MVYVAHRDVVDHDVLHTALINLLESQSAAPHAGTVADSNVAITAIRLSTEFDAPAHPVHLFRHIRAVKKGSELIACNDTVGN